MTGLDKDKINRIIQAASKGSKFYSKQQENQTRWFADFLLFRW